MDDVLRKKVEEAATIIVAGGVVAFPTETYYGLAVDPFNEEALARLYRLKKRSHSKPLLTLVRQRDDVSLLVEHVPVLFQSFMDLWPAPLTLVFPALAELPLLLTAGTSTIGIRVSSHPVASALIRACGGPITATSANISGAPPCSTPVMIIDQFGDQLDYILDGGKTPGEGGSTLIGCSSGKPVILREGVFSPTILKELMALHER